MGDTANDDGMVAAFVHGLGDAFEPGQNRVDQWHIGGIEVQIKPIEPRTGAGEPPGKVDLIGAQHMNGKSAGSSEMPMPRRGPRHRP